VARVSLQEIINNNLPFRGKMILGLGDFRQVAPVFKGAGITATLDASIRSSTLWEHFQILRLTAPVRNAADLEYADWVDAIGDGELTGSGVPISFIQAVPSLDAALDYLYPASELLSPHLIGNRSFLSPLNVHVDEFNQSVLNRLESEHPVGRFKNFSSGVQANLLL
jgi:hypothetical protein